ncbi:hypothetical protein SLT36_05300 [Aminobacter sp. BA135]|uniref:hypothetical protein n=1 Tax=Aminobacter sp. BA135 TaxID=537596 RepID=UPI003D79DEF7
MNNFEMLQPERFQKNLSIHFYVYTLIQQNKSVLMRAWPSKRDMRRPRQAKNNRPTTRHVRGALLQDLRRRTWFAGLWRLTDRAMSQADLPDRAGDSGDVR